VPEAKEAKQQQIRRIAAKFLQMLWVSNHRLARLVQTYGITQPQFKALAALMHVQPCTMSRLTDCAFTDPPTMTGIVNRLVNMGLVHRHRSQQDRRLVLVEPTPAGTKMMQEITQVILEGSKDLITVLSQKELAEMDEIFSFLLSCHVERYGSAIELGPVPKPLDSFLRCSS